MYACADMYCYAIDHTRNIAPHPIHHHRILTVNGVAQSVVLVGADAVLVAAGDYHSMVLTKDGTVWTTGWNGDGQLGDGSTTNKHSFAKVIGTCDIWLWSTCTLSTPPPLVLAFNGAPISMHIHLHLHLHHSYTNP